MSFLRRKAGAVRPVRTRPILQMEAVECGPAALAMVLAYHGRHVPIEELRQVCGVSRDGSTALNLIRAARGYGLEAKGLRMEPESLADLPGPAILFWQFNHFVVYEGTGRRFGKPQIFLDDPAFGRRTVSMEDFDGGFTGVVLTFRPGPGFTPGGRSPRLLAGLSRRLRGLAAPLLIAILASLLLAVAGLAMPALTRTFVDDVLLGRDRGVLPPLFAVMLASVVITAVLTALLQVFVTRTQLVASTAGHAGFLRHLLRLPVTFFTQRSTAELTRRLETNETVAQILVRDVTSVFVNTLIVVSYAGLMWSYDPELAALGIAVALLNIAALRLVTRLRESGVAKMQMDRAKFFAVSFDGLRLIETMKATAAENEYFRRWSGHLAALLDSEQRVGVPTAVFATIAPLLAASNSAIILLVGGVRAVEGHVTIGLLVAFQTLLAGFNRPVGELTGMAGQIQDFAADVARLKDVEAFEVDPLFTRPEPRRLHRLDGYVEFDAVAFGYNPLSPPLLTGFSFKVGPGRQVALVGDSGSGKSTVAKLISCLYAPWSGRILLDGRPREEVPRSVLASSVAFVDQDIFLFEGTVRDNVALWDPSIPDEAVVAALRDAAVYDVVAGRPGGIYATVEEQGRNFSGGQRQRLEIARALVRNPSVLVLDEATSALDAETEKVIGGNLRRRGCACVVIAHRLSTIRDSDEIIVLNGGHVVERGRHEELVLAGGSYADLIGGH